MSEVSSNPNNKANVGGWTGAVVGALSGVGAVATTAAIQFPPGVSVPWYGYVIAGLAPAIIGGAATYYSVWNAKRNAPS